MNIVRTFAVVESCLFSVLYEREIIHEFRRLFNLWRDAEYLEQFFYEHQNDLNRNFWRNLSIEEAIFKTQKDAKRLEKKLIDIAERGKTNRYETLSTLFKPLENNPDRLDQLEKSKTYGLIKPSWLRIYAIRINTNVFMVSGGAIKLTQSMNERPHLIQELEKLNVVKNYCRDNFDIDTELMELH